MDSPPRRLEYPAMNTQEWRSLIRQLRTHFPVETKVDVRRTRIRNDCGRTIFNGETYRIVVDSRQEKQGQIDTLLHEWAHVCAIEEAYRHKGRWGVIHGAIFEAWANNFEKPEPPEPQGNK